MHAEFDNRFRGKKNNGLYSSEEDLYSRLVLPYYMRVPNDRCIDILPRLKPWDSFRRERHHIGQKASVIAVVQEGFITRSQ